jgi:phosphoglycolate phosphatase-like HAD superfamily hydrolase
MEHALIELQLSREIIAQAIKALHDKLGWDASVGHVIPSAPLAAGTWQEAVELSSNVFQHYGLSSSVASEWHKELRNVHEADPPVISNLCDMLQSCRDLGLIVAVCTSDDRSPTNNALRNWSITHLVDVRIIGVE